MLPFEQIKRDKNLKIIINNLGRKRQIDLVNARFRGYWEDCVTILCIGVQGGRATVPPRSPLSLAPPHPT